MTGAADIQEHFHDLLHAHERMRARRRRELGLSVNEEVVLLLLTAGMTAPSELSRAIGMTTAGMTNLLDRLEREGFVRREAHRTDKRRVLLMLTKKGYRVQLASEALDAALARLAGRLDPGERLAVCRFLADAAEAVERHTVPASD